MLLLESDNASIQFSEDEWCKVSLVQLGKVTYLGAEDRKIVLNRLYEALTNPNSKNSTGNFSVVNGVKEFWVMTLNELHTLFLLSELLSDETRRLQLFDEKGDRVIEMRLSKTTLDEWADGIYRDMESTESTGTHTV